MKNVEILTILKFPLESFKKRRSDILSFESRPNCHFVDLLLSAQDMIMIKIWENYLSD